MIAAPVAGREASSPVRTASAAARLGEPPASAEGGRPKAAPPAGVDQLNGETRLSASTLFMSMLMVIWVVVRFPAPS